MTQHAAEVAAERAPSNLDELEERLSRPNDRVLAALRACPGDVIVLGAGGKMGPSLSRMLQRAADELNDGRSIVAVSRFGGNADASLQHAGVPGSERIHALSRDLTSPPDVETLPDAPNVVFMAGQKFGTTSDPSSTWAMNASVPTLVANRYKSSRIVAFSTGNVYSLSALASGGSREGDELRPVGEYAASCLARERIFTHYSRRHNTPVLIFRLNYAVDLRYGVLVDIAKKVLNGDRIDLSMGHFNVIWQGDANAAAVAALAHCASPPAVLNVTGRATLAVRDVAATFGQIFGREPVFHGHEERDALLSNSGEMSRTIGDPLVNESVLLAWVAAWVQSGGTSLDKPTNFEERSGRF